MAETMTCEHCGKPIEMETLQGRERCPHCGEVMEAEIPSEGPPVEPAKGRVLEAKDSVWLSLAAILLGLGILVISSSGLASEYLGIKSICSIWPIGAPTGALCFLIGALISIVNSIRMRRRVSLGFLLGGIMLTAAVLMIVSLYVLDSLLHPSRIQLLSEECFSP